MAEPLRILRITPRWDWRVLDPPVPVDPAEAIGGVSLQVRRLAGAIGAEQVVLARRPAGAPARSRWRGIEIRAVGRPGVAGVHRSHLAWLLGVARELVRDRRFDVVHVHASGIVEPLLAALLARVVLRRPVVLTLHCSAQATYVAVSRRDEAVQVVTRAAERAAVRAAAVTLVLTRRVQEALRAPRVEVMPDVVEPPVAVEPLAVPPGRPVLAYVGRTSAEKGWEDLAELHRRLDDVHLLVCGGGPDLARLRAAVDASRATFTGPVDAVGAALAAADVLVLPSRHEELGSVLLEAMAAGIPSVAYAVGGTPEAIREGETGLLVPAGDVEALAGAVRRALSDDALRRSAREAGPRLAMEHHEPAAAAARLERIYASLR